MRNKRAVSLRKYLFWQEIEQFVPFSLIFCVLAFKIHYFKTEVLIAVMLLFFFKQVYLYPERQCNRNTAKGEYDRSHFWIFFQAMLTPNKW